MVKDFHLMNKDLAQWFLSQDKNSLFRAYFICVNCGHEQYNDEYGIDFIFNWHNEDCTFCREGHYELAGYKW